MERKAKVLKQIQAAIEHEAHVDLRSHPISISFADGTLVLEGELPHVGAKKLALRAAAEVAGIGGITDRLRVGGDDAVGDGAIRDAVCRRLLHDTDFQNCAVHAWVKGQRETLQQAGTYSSGSIDVMVDDGIVMLGGHVISLSHKRMAGVLPWWVRGCRDVVNQLQVEPPEDDTDDEVADALRHVLEADPYVRAEQIGIASRDHVVTLDGVVASEGERTRVEMDAWCLFDVSKVINHIEVR